MARDITCYDLLISCPSDIQEELHAIDEVISQFNEQFSDTTGVMIRSKHWSKSSFSESGDKPQKLLNKQFVYDCDAAIAVFWTRFGTPTDQYGSGSEEEIEIMLEAGKQVFMGFCEREVKLQNVDHEQYKKVLAFREKYKDRGLYFTYSTLEEFHKTVFAHFTKFFLTKKDLDEIKSKKVSDLKIKSISNGKLCDSLVISKFKPTGHKLKDQIIDEVVEQYANINAFQLQHETHKVKPINPFSESVENIETVSKAFIKPVEIPDDIQKTILEMANNLDITMDDDFFYLGDLHSNALKGITSHGAYLVLEGDEDAKKKYHAINKLNKEILELLDWAPFEVSFDKLFCISLVLTNEGLTFDEDINITLTFPANFVIRQNSLPELSIKTAQYILDNFPLKKLFGIPSTINYEEYTEKSYMPYIAPTNAISFPYSSRNYCKEFRAKLGEVFHYNYFDDKEASYIKYHFDYLKHNNAMAFPSVIFINENLSSIEYSITSKHNSDIIKGTISVANER